MLKFKFIIIWLLFLLITIAEVSASSEYNITNFAIHGEYLYFQPIFTNDFIATPNVNGQLPFNLQPGGPGKKNKFDYVSGYRLHVLYFTKNCGFSDFSLGMTYLPASHSIKTSLDSFSPNSGRNANRQPSIPGYLRANHHLIYYAADVLTTFPIFSHSQFDFSVKPGIHYARMDYQTHAHFSTNANTQFRKGKLREKSNTSGLGPQLEFQLNYSFNNWLTFNSKIKGGVLLSKATAHFKYKSYFAEAHITPSCSIHQYKECWKFFPFWQAQIGMNISVPLCSDRYTLEIEIGYEYLTYPDFINRLLFSGNTSSSANPKSLFSNFDFQGPYIALMSGF